MTTDKLSIPIDKLMVFHDGKWSQYKNKPFCDFFLRIHFDQVFISQADKMIENLSGKVKGFFKNDVLIIVFCDAVKKVRKIKFQLKTDDINGCITKLGHLFPLLNHSHLPGTLQPKFKTLEEVLQCTLNNMGNGTILNMPTNYDDFVKICVLDPKFPDLVTHTAKILENISKMQ